MREIPQSGSEGGGVGTTGAPYPCHDYAVWHEGKTWVTGPSPVMTQGRTCDLVPGSCASPYSLRIAARSCKTTCLDTPCGLPAHNE